MAQVIRVQIFARDCQNDPVVRDLLSVATFLSSTVRRFVSVESSCSTLCSCSFEGPVQVYVDGIQLLQADLVSLVDHLHLKVMGLAAA